MHRHSLICLLFSLNCKTWKSYLHLINQSFSIVPVVLGMQSDLMASGWIDVSHCLLVALQDECNYCQKYDSIRIIFNRTFFFFLQNNLVQLLEKKRKESQQLLSPFLLLSHPDDVLAGGDGQTHQTGAIDGHDAVANVKLAAAFSRAAVKKVGHNHSGQDGAPARLHHCQT